MNKSLNINSEERVGMLLTTLLLAGLHAMLLLKYWPLLGTPTEWAWHNFSQNFHMSGFDPYIYNLTTYGKMLYEPLRHPLLQLLCLPLYGLNMLLWNITGTNCALLLVSLLWITCGVCSELWLWRILRKHLAATQAEAAVLTAFFFSMAYVLLSLTVPDHFALSLAILLFTLYRSSAKLSIGQLFTAKEAAVLTALAGGVTLSNAGIVALMVVCTNARAFFRWRMLASVGVVCTLLLGIGLLSPSSTPASGVGHWLNTDVAVLPTLWHNVFGESFQFHREHLMGDVLIKRPVFVDFTWWPQYVVEAITICLTALGAWYGRRSRLTLLLLACMAYNAALHLAAGFGINEVYIMTCHWAWAVPLLMLYAAKRLGRPTLLVIALIALYQLTYNIYLISHILTWPLKYFNLK